MHVPRKCPECEASWREYGLPCPDILNEVLDEGVWRCHGCGTIVTSEDVGSGHGDARTGETAENDGTTGDDLQSDGAPSSPAVGAVTALLRQLVTLLSR